MFMHSSIKKITWAVSTDLISFHRIGGRADFDLGRCCNRSWLNERGDRLLDDNLLLFLLGLTTSVEMSVPLEIS